MRTTMNVRTTAKMRALLSKVTAQKTTKYLISKCQVPPQELGTTKKMRSLLSKNLTPKKMRAMLSSFHTPEGKRRE
jgi:hypothetical protein